MRFALVNESTVVTTAQAKAIVAALKLQAPQVAKAWERYEWTITYQTSIDKVAADAIPVVLLDDADQADALAYHDVDPHGRPYCKVFAKTILAAGGTVLDGSLSVSAATSHEVIECFCDPPAAFWSTYNAAGGLVALEACDPVQDEFYVLNGVAVSDFVLPAYFSPFSPGPYSHLGTLTKPAPALAKGGYAIVESSSGERQIFGHVPAWKPPSSRSYQRLAHDFIVGERSPEVLRLAAFNERTLIAAQAEGTRLIDYPEGSMSYVKSHAKAVVAFLVAVVGGAIAQGLIVGQAAAVATVIIGAIATLGVHQVANQP